MDTTEVLRGQPDRSGWIGLAVIVLRQCGLAQAEIQAIIAGGDAEIVRKIWSCVGSGGGGRLR
ncbi:MAG TPA: hypothetical protein VE915_08600 [Actinomycetota bacterium]|jgi:hypothetical protein|nr:hypothetical protein [Actinomycetota bacterium]